MVESPRSSEKLFQVYDSSGKIRFSRSILLHTKAKRKILGSKLNTLFSLFFITSTFVFNYFLDSQLSN